jgi:hypothetical protein
MPFISGTTLQAHHAIRLKRAHVQTRTPPESGVP